MLTTPTAAPVLKSGDAVVTPAPDPIVARVLLILFTVAVTVAAATMFARW